MVGSKTGIVVGALLCLILAACAAKQDVQLYQAGVASRATAEGAYQSVYLAYKAGQVDEPTLAKARVAYDSWRIAHDGYVQALIDRSAGADDKEVAVRRALAVLLGLAAQHGLLGTQ